MQLDAPGRGFSFRRDEPLDMRMDTIERARPRPRCSHPSTSRTLADVIYEFGEERHARRIARAIVDGGKTRRSRRRGSWPTSCGGRFRARGTRASIRRRGRSRRFASGSTASSRGWTAFSREPPRRLAPGGRLVVMTFHSLEDRVVKHTLRALQAAGTVCDPDEAADGADGSRDRAEPARAQREAAGGRAAGLIEDRRT